MLVLEGVACFGRWARDIRGKRRTKPPYACSWAVLRAFRRVAANSSTESTVGRT